MVEYDNRYMERIGRTMPTNEEKNGRKVWNKKVKTRNSLPS